jgi:tRNA pseudouridine55 synthase
MYQHHARGLHMLSSGFLLINKPKGVTSFQCVRRVRKFMPRGTRVGHGGTLDPFATGLLVICVGRAATKMSSQLLGKDKTYIVKAKLGELTDTLDYTGTILEVRDALHFTKEMLQDAIISLGSSYVQTPPVYSALKHEGRPLYKHARAQLLDPETLKTVIESKARLVELYKIELLEFTPPFFTFSAHVSKGTYIRSLANDIACKLGSVATTYELERTRIGALSLEQATSLEALDSHEAILSNLRETL